MTGNCRQISAEPPTRNDTMTTWDGDEYQARFDRMSATGKNMHGEATFIRAFEPTTVLDAGCGTGRVGVELAAHGIEVVGVDVDPSMLATARDRDSSIEWIEADLRSFDLGRHFDVVIMAGNVPLFTPAGTQPALVRAVARHVAPDGLLVAGFSTDWADRPYDTVQYDTACSAAGLALVERFSTWDRAPWTSSSTYAVSVHQLPATSM